jgi:hypothetical protein
MITMNNGQYTAMSDANEECGIEKQEDALLFGSTISIVPIGLSSLEPSLRLTFCLFYGMVASVLLNGWIPADEIGIVVRGFDENFSIELITFLTTIVLSLFANDINMHDDSKPLQKPL